MSVYGRDRYDDSRTSVSSSRRDGGGGGYTTVKRYVVNDNDLRSNVGRDRRYIPDRPGERVEETRIVRREREVEEPPPVRERESRRERDEPRYSTSELVIRNDRDREDDRRGSYYRREEPSTSDRELVIRRTTETAEPRHDDLAVSRVDDRRDYRGSEPRYRDDYISPTRGGFDDRDLQRYTRNTEYFAPAPQPQTIIIRQEPIIIRERAREEDYQMIRRSDVEEERSIARREPEPPKEEEYFYEKKVRERIDDEPRRRDRSEDSWHERRVMRREVSPHDSVSQVGGRHRRGSDYSDDSMVYVRRTKEYDDDSRGSSPHNKRNLAAGVVAGIGAAELLRNHKKKEGKDTSHGVGRLGRDVGAGALGAIAVEGISRARSQYRSRSRRRKSRGRSDSRSRSRRRSRSRSESRSKLKTLGALGLGAAALAAAAAVAQKKMGNKDKEASPDRGRSSSRHRHGESVQQLANDPDADDARNPKHRNIRMAEAGAAGAAITALIDRARSKSRGGGDRSRSKVRQAVPVVAAGLGSAALAGLYEKNKAKKEAEVIAKEERRERKKSRSRSRQRSEYYDGPSQATFSDPHLIEYGDGPMHGNNFGPDYYGRPAPQEPYYANQNAVVPAAAGTAGYAAARDGRSRSISRDRRSRSRSISSSPGGHRRRNRSGDAPAEAAGIGAVATSEHERRKREKRERKARKRAEEQRDPYEDTYNPQYGGQPDPYAQFGQPNHYPQSSQFPPPPGSGPQPYAATAPTAGAAYNPQDFPPPPPSGAPPGPGYDAYASGGNPYAPRRDENVSAPNPVTNGLNSSRGFDPTPSINVQPPSITTPGPSPNPGSIPSPNATPNASSSYIPPTDRGPSPQRTRAVSQPPPTGPRKSVAFAEKPEVSVTGESEASSPEQYRHRSRRERGYEAGDDTDSTPDDMRRRAQRPSDTTRNLDPATANGDDGRKRRHHHRRRSADPSASSQDGPSSSRPSKEARPTSPADSDATVELPARFDDKGRKKSEPGEDPVADRIDAILAGKGTTGKLFGNFVDGIFGPEGRKKKER